MQDAHVIALEAEPKPSDMAAIVKGLGAFNASKADGEMPNYLLVAVRDAGGNMVGGLMGATYFGWLQVQAVWLPEELRGNGYGTSLIAQAEKEAMRRGCFRAYLETLSFQALPFYEKCGYVVFSELKDFPPHGSRYALTKMLGESPAAFAEAAEPATRPARRP